MRYFNNSYFQDSINKFLEEKHLIARTIESYNPNKVVTYAFNNEETKEIIKQVQKNRHSVYQADLEEAIKYILFHEIPRYNNISEYSLSALKIFLNVLDKYNPFENNGQKFINKVLQYVNETNNFINGVDFEENIRKLSIDFYPIFSSNRYMGCISSTPNLRGFTCSLWKLFHYFSIRSMENENSDDNLLVLRAIYGYVKYFFGCTDCAEHFQVRKHKSYYIIRSH